MKKSPNKPNEQQAENLNGVKKGTKTAQAIALAVMTILGSEQALLPKEAHAGLAHAQQITNAEVQRVSVETQRVNADSNLADRQLEAINTANNILVASKGLNPKSKKYNQLLNQLAVLKIEIVALCTARGKFSNGDKNTINGIEEIFLKSNFTPDPKFDKNFKLCDSNGCNL